MYPTISATEARIHFGEVMRRARQGPIIVERDGKPEVVVLSKESFDALLAGLAGSAGWKKLLEEAHQRVRADLAGRTLPEPESILSELRQERYAPENHLP